MSDECTRTAEYRQIKPGWNGLSFDSFVVSVRNIGVPRVSVSAASSCPLLSSIKLAVNGNAPT
jgi:hypothetical protein